MLAWFGELNAKERRTMGACFGGWALDAFDVQMYSFVIPTVIVLWALSRGEAGLIGTVTLLISSLGGWFSRDAGRPLWPGADAADHDPVVFDLHLPVRVRPEFRAAVHPARDARVRLWRRVGGGRGADGRGDPRQVPRPRRRPGADRLGRRLGRRGAGLYRALCMSCPNGSPGALLFAIGLLPAVFVFWIRRHIDEPEIFHDKRASARRSASRICFPPSARRICGPRSRFR